MDEEVAAEGFDGREVDMDLLAMVERGITLFDSLEVMEVAVGTEVVTGVEGAVVGAEEGGGAVGAVWAALNQANPGLSVVAEI